MELNPYAPTTTVGQNDIIPATDDAELVRRKYLSHEANIQGVGGLYLLGAVLGCLAFALFLVMGIVAEASNANRGVSLTGLVTLAVVGIIGLAISFVQGYAGWSMRTLNPKGKPFAIVVSCIGLLGFPLGTLISAWILWMLLSEKGEVVFSPQYRAVIEATPHIKYRTSIITWIFLGCFLLFIGIIVFAAIAGSRR